MAVSLHAVEGRKVQSEGAGACWTSHHREVSSAAPEARVTRLHHHSPLSDTVLCQKAASHPGTLPSCGSFLVTMWTGSWIPPPTPCEQWVLQDHWLSCCAHPVCKVHTHTPRNPLLFASSQKLCPGRYSEDSPLLFMFLFLRPCYLKIAQSQFDTLPLYSLHFFSVTAWHHFYSCLLSVSPTRT